MKALMAVWSAVASMALAGSLAAEPVTLQPADPQPGKLRAGLAVMYAYPQDVRDLTEASAALKRGAEVGRPLAGLDHRDTNEGDNTLTSNRALHVAARISGYVRFDKPGVYNIDFLTNDGLRARIGGQIVGEFDGRQSCDTTVMTEVKVPVAGWYPLDALYFQRLGTACLHMRMGPEGKRLRWMPDAAFAH
ncbi:hypothetical protein PXK00_17810 [Phaeobacter sp. QD34_3]|uniref:PA14 domain-containing protein n=1 Tax=unclassified Phaeobacter TaxID=2621772 RepID=UPI00237F21C8|nr:MULTISPECIES: PA14 domain-containing protein [unclassified Phaeobacter]MDE4134970.1 hypothetical protein [Phaeobacter sp. QD34_3]MDE4138600.1 hypothetical protein [Phaeobacter sp. QD34_24]